MPPSASPGGRGRRSPLSSSGLLGSSAEFSPGLLEEGLVSKASHRQLNNFMKRTQVPDLKPMCIPVSPRRQTKVILKITKFQESASRLRNPDLHAMRDRRVENSVASSLLGRNSRMLSTKRRRLSWTSRPGPGSLRPSLLPLSSWPRPSGGGEIV